MRCWVAILFAGLLASSTLAQQVELQIEARTLQEGETVELTLICTNTGDPATPQFEVPDGLELRLANPTPARSSMVSLINGRRSETTTYTFSLRLTGIKAGSYMLSPIVVPAGTTVAAGATFLTRKPNRPMTAGESVSGIRAKAAPPPNSLRLHRTWPGRRFRPTGSCRRAAASARRGRARSR